ncbi:MAG: type II toxin-antitoxin system YafQ family toxin [Candidatus Omnitrophica bacterium]|nr:type II toxin-antitoxin system YafQ family toxin [Candidatus Omnitrophota bacterium]
MRAVIPTKKFGRDLKKMSRRKKDISKLKKIVDILQTEGRLPSKYKPHPLIGDWIPSWDCHIETDWILIYRVTKDEVFLVRTGTHSDLFN